MRKIGTIPLPFRCFLEGRPRLSQTRTMSVRDDGGASATRWVTCLLAMLALANRWSFHSLLPRPLVGLKLHIEVTHMMSEGASDDIRSEAEQDWRLLPEFLFRSERFFSRSVNSGDNKRWFSSCLPFSLLPCGCKTELTQSLKWTDGCLCSAYTMINTTLTCCVPRGRVHGSSWWLHTGKRRYAVVFLLQGRPQKERGMCLKSAVTRWKRNWFKLFVKKSTQKINNITCKRSRRCSMYEFLSGTAKIHFFFSNCRSLQSSPSLLDHSFKRPYGPDYLRGTIGNQIWDELWLNPLSGSLIITANSFQQYNSC